MSVFDEIIEWVQAKIALLWGAIEPAVSAFAISLIEAGGEILLDAAREAIEEVLADPSILTNSDKRNAAIGIIIQKMADRGVQVGETAALNAVQAVYTALKAEE